MSGITEKQAAFIRTLAERIGAKALAKIGTLPQDVERALALNVTAREASNLIGALLAIAPAQERTGTVTEPGYYLHDGRVFYVRHTKDKSRLYAMVMMFSTSQSGAKVGRWVFERGAMAHLQADARLTVEQAAAQGHLHGVCVICGQALTDPASVTRGIGPVCIKKL